MNDCASFTPTPWVGAKSDFEYRQLGKILQ
jgi:hypothetical protein